MRSLYQQGLSSFVQHQWETSSLAPRQVRAEPYKLVIYGPGGFFKLHQDTPEKNLVGTALLRLCDTSDGELVVYPPPYLSLKLQQPFQWGHQAENLCMFYPDLSHEFKTISHGYRVILAFKIFFDDSQLATNLYRLANETIPNKKSISFSVRCISKA